MSWYQPGSWGWVQRAVAAMSNVETVDHGASSEGDYARQPGYSALASMSAFSRFSYVYATVQRRAADMSGLPIRIYVGHPERDPDAEVLTDHPLYTLLDQPNLDTTGEEFRRQLMVDLQLTGNFYAGKVGTENAPPISLIRWHPETVRIVPQRYGRAIAAYEVSMGDAGRKYAPDVVMHIRSPSWESGPAGLYGQGVIRPLNDELNTHMAARRHQMKLAGQGRPDVVLSPADDGDMWGPDARKEVLAAWATMSAKGGPLVMSGAVKADFLNLSPRDMEYQALNSEIIASIMAATQTPPVILGRETANYATARQQDAVYWRGIQHDARLIDAGVTVSLAAMYPEIRGKRIYIRHDFSGVLALQLERTAQVQRAHLHMLAGAAPSDAYAYEGLAGAPVADEPIDIGFPMALGMESEQRNGGAHEVRQRVMTADAMDGWLRWEKQLQGPAERQIKVAVASYLSAASTRYQRRVSESFAGKAIANGDGLVMVRAPVISDIEAENEERSEMRKSIGRTWRLVYRRAMSSALASLPVDVVEFDPDRAAVARELEKLVVHATRTQTDAIRKIVEEGLESGWSVGQINAAIRTSTAFGPVRTLRIARTESTRAVNLGTLNGYRQAVAAGVKLRKVWQAQPDARDTHLELDGQQRSVDEQFVIPSSGDRADSPGTFGIASEDINCRCQLSNVVADPAPLLG